MAPTGRRRESWLKFETGSDAPAAATLHLPISYTPYVPLRVRRRSRRAARWPFLVAFALVICLAAVVLVDRACLSAAPAAAGPHPGLAGGTRPLPGQLATTLEFSTGACKAFAPTGKSRGRTVFIDPGHGGPDPGVLGRSGAGVQLKESTLALAVATELSRRLRADGYWVVLSRTADTSVVKLDSTQLDGGALNATQVRQDLEGRVLCANASHAAALVSVHFNGYPDASVGGTQTIYDTARPFAADNLRLAQSLQSAMVAQMELTDRGLVTDDALQAPVLSDRGGSYGHLLLLGPPAPGWLDQGTSMAGAVVEPLFLTAPGEAALAASPGSQRQLAAALASGIENYLAAAPTH